MSRLALALGLALGASAAQNSITAPTGADKLTVALLGGEKIASSTNPTAVNRPGKNNMALTVYHPECRLWLDWLAASASGLLQQCPSQAQGQWCRHPPRDSERL